jgi:transcriptional regulator with XRE-family HTH domain
MTFCYGEVAIHLWRGDWAKHHYIGFPTTDSQRSRNGITSAVTVHQQGYSVGMEARTLPDAFKLIMKQRGCSQNKLARELRRSQGWISDVVNGKAGLEFAKMIDLLSRVGWEVVIRPKREEDPVKRRAFVTAAASVMFVPSPKAGPYADPANVRELARRVAQARYEHGGGMVASMAIKHVQRIKTLVTSKDRKLQEAASDLAVEAVWTLNDAHGFDAGENVGRLALTLARLSESTAAQSRSYSALTALNVERGDAGRALKYAERGVILPDVPDTQRTWVKLRKGWTQALLPGHEAAARDELESVGGVLRHNEGLCGQSLFDRADMLGQLGIAFQDLRVYGESQGALSDALNLFGDSSPTLTALCLAHQSIAALRASQDQLAADLMLHLAQAAALISSPRVDKSLRMVLAQSAKWSSVPAIRDARAHLEAVTHPAAHA